MAKPRKEPQARVTYSDAIAAKVCVLIAAGHSLRQIGAMEGMPSRSGILKWLTERAEFVDQYARAREMQAEHFADEILEIADDGSNDWTEREQKDGTKETVLDHEHVSRSKLRVDARRWLMSKMAPKKYGDKQTLEHQGKDGAPLIPVLNVTIGGNQSIPTPKAG